MRMGTRTVAVCAVICLHAGASAAQGRSMTLEEVLVRARERAPQIVSARLGLEEARGRLLGASVRFQANPELDASLGNRNAPETRYTDFSFALGQRFEPGARRSARIDVANAAIGHGSANIDEVTRTVLRLAASAYYRTVHANERIKLLTATQELAQSVFATAERRFKAGDIAVLDLNIARVSLARIKAEREGAEASKALSLGDLRQLLRLEPDVGVEGSLARTGEVALNTALEAVAQRPDLRGLELAIEEAEAERRLGESLAKPDYGVAVRYAREEGDQIIQGGLTMTLPMFSKGQEQRAVGTARAARLRSELEAARTRAQLEVRAAFDVYGRRLAAVSVLEADAMPGLAENEQLTTRSFEVGQLGLPQLLLIRREILDTRFQYLDALLEAALARIELDASAAILR